MVMTKLPKKVNIFSKIYTIEYIDNVGEVDQIGKSLLYGQIDYGTCRITVYNHRGDFGSVVQTLIHEILHGIINALGMEETVEKESAINALATGLTDTLIRNDFIKFK